MQVKTYKTERGAKAFMRKCKDRRPQMLYQIACGVGLDFRTYWFVEVFIETPKPRWIGVGPFTRS